MNRNPVSDPALAALGKFQGTIDRNSNFRQQAFDHNLGRNVKVAKVLAFITLLRQGGVALVGNVECAGDPPQNFSSSQSMTHVGQPAAPHQAAHFLPGRIRIGGRDLWHFAIKPAARSAIEFLFAEVEHLPLPFNHADSAAEAKGQPSGLCAAFVRGCSTIIGSTMPINLPAGKLNMTLLQAGYDAWHRNANPAFDNAIASKNTKAGIPPLVGNQFDGYTAESISARSAAPASQWNRDDSLSVLQYYKEDQQQRNWSWVSTRCRSALNEVEAHFRA
jgi:hypothetical protein